MSFYEEILALFNKAKSNIKNAINLSTVYTYYEIGRRIVEEEQNGSNRAEYGKRLIAELSDSLTQNYGKGFSVGNLKNIRQFYRIYIRLIKLAKQCLANLKTCLRSQAEGNYFLVGCII